MVGNHSRKSKVFYILFFVAAFFFSVFILIHGNYLAIAGALIVLLISVYFLVDIHEKEIKAKEEKEEQKEREHLEEHFTKLNRLEDLEKVQKAIYTAVKKNTDLLNQHFNELFEKTDKMIEYTKEIEEIKDLSKQNLRAIDMIHGGIKSFYEFEKNGVKTIIKYNKENSRQIALNTSENIDRLINEIKEESNIINAGIKEVGDIDFSSIGEKYENISSVMIENTVIMSKSLENLSNTIEAHTEELQGKMDTLETKMKVIPDTVAFEVSKKVEKTLDTKLARAKKAKEQAGIKETGIKEPEQMKVTKSKEERTELRPEMMDSSVPVNVEKPKKIVVEPEPVKSASDSNQKMGQDDIATPIASMNASTPELEPVKVEKPKKNIEPVKPAVDANQKMGQDDIAALIASMNVSTPESEPVKVEKPKKNIEPEPAKPVVEANEKMGQDDIAALIALMNASTPEPESVKVERPKKNIEPVKPSSDANQKMDQDDIAALIASMTNNQ